MTSPIRTSRPLAAVFALSLALLAALPARATTFVKDVMLVGGTLDEVSALTNSLSAQGWSVIVYDLNHGCKSTTDYIFLLYQSEADTSGGRDYVTGFYVKSGASGVSNTLAHGGRTYHLVPYDGGDHFKGQKGDLNSHAGGDAIHLYYTKDNSSGRAVTGITFDDTQSGGLGANGASSPGYDLNAGAGGDYVYMHVSSTVVAYGLAYDLAGGALPGGASNPATYDVDTATFTLANPARTGYTFAGWTWDGQSTPATTATVARGSTGNKSFVAHWSLDTYTLAYDLKGGALPSGVTNPATYDVNTATFTLSNPSRSGHVFLGWTWSGQTTPVKAVTIAKGSTGHRSFTANWSPVCSLTYDLAGGALPAGVTNPATYTAATPAFTLANPTRSGYAFAGWTWDGQTTPVQTVTIPQGSTGDRSFTANWLLLYALSYDLAGGALPAGATNPATYTAATPAFTLVNPTRSGCLFAGWTWDGQSTPATTATIPKGSTGDKSFLAHWTASPKGSFDACEGFSTYITLSGWAFDPDEPALSLAVVVQIFRSGGGALLSELSLTADRPRNDVNNRYGITGQHGFRATIPVAEAGSCTVKVWALDSSDGSLRAQVGNPKTVATTANAHIVQLADVGGSTNVVTYEAQDGDVLVGSAKYDGRVFIAAGATVTLCGAHVDRLDPSGGKTAIRCLGDATLVLADGTENSATGIGGCPAVQAGPPGTTLSIRGGGTLDAGNVENGVPFRSFGSAIGSAVSGSCGDILIAGGTVNATGGAGSPGIGAGHSGTCGRIFIESGVTRVTATAGGYRDSYAASYTVPPSIGPGLGASCGTVFVGGVEVGQIDKSPYTYDPNDPDGPDIPIHYNTVAIDVKTTDVSLRNGAILTGTGGLKTHVTIADGATVRLAGVNITTSGAALWAGITCEGDATIILEGDNAVKGGGEFPGISVPEGKTLTIQGDGSLTATGGSRGAGIGGGKWLSCGNIVIEGGAITATGDKAAGIGTGDNSTYSCGNITIGEGVTSLVASGTPCIGGKNSPAITIAPGLVSEGSLSEGTFTLRQPTAYELWAAGNGLSGAWDAKDEGGVANVFRYLFGQPSGAFDDPPLLTIEPTTDGHLVAKTPPLVNTTGFTCVLSSADDPSWTSQPALQPLNPTGTTPIDDPATPARTRFFRLKATPERGEAAQ